MSVTVYTQPACQPCLATKRLLTKRGVEFTEIDVTQDAEARELVRSLGYLEAPVVIAGDTHWSGYRPDQIHALTKEN
ncbi:glutaredoxin family protein [Oerskovia paurometabola]|uniref:glutaredoxin family protein n=1 Tax=Oerskovia paurometabola TaxID=162170 RepID=UPI00344076F9